MRRRDHGGGFLLNAAVRIKATDRKGLESQGQWMALFGAPRTQRLLQYSARPIFAGEHLEWVTPGQRLPYHLPKPIKPRPDGKTTLTLPRWSGWIGSPFTCSFRPRVATAGGHMASWRLMPHSVRR